MNNKTKRISIFAVVAVFVAAMLGEVISYADDDVDISTAFPDPVFSAAIALHYDTNGDGKLSPDERSAEKMIVSGIVDELAESMGVDADDLTISSIEGIEHFSNLKTLYCNNVGTLTSLDVSALTNLEVLNCSDNGLTELDLSANTALKRLHCCSNEFTSLDFSANENLEFLHCYANLELTSLNVTGLTNLEELRCDGCQITELDLTTNTALYTLNCSHNKLSQINLSNTSANSLTDYHLGYQNITLEMIYADGKIQAPIALDAASVYSTSLDDGETAYANGAFFTTDYSKIRDGFTYQYSTGKSGCAEMKVNVGVYHTHDYAVTASDVENKKLTINCQICSEDEHVLDADLVTNTVDPTCTADGKTTHTLTAEYDSNPYTGIVEIDLPSLGHNYQPTVTAPTCTAQGYTTYTCSRCTDSYVDDYIDATGHTNGEPTVENKIDATCTTAGSYDEVVYCTVCTAEVSREPKTIGVLGHNFGNWTETTAAVAPTCTVAGATAIETQYCSRCDATNSRGGDTVNALGHNYASVTTAPTCTEQGYTTYTCSRCTDSYVDDYTDATGHTNGTPVEENIIDATCTTAGSYDEVVYCTVCTAELSREPKTIGVLGHNFGNWTETTAAVAPTCTVAGKTKVETQYCSRCDATNTRGGDTVNALGHNYASVTTAPTCTEQGYTTYSCTRCTDNYKSDYTDATGHTNGTPVEENKIDATCTTAGSYDEVVYCTVCTAELSREPKTIGVLGHNFGDWTETTAAVAPTCTVAGKTKVETQYCSRCDATNTRGGETVNALGHNYQPTVTEPTCTEQGYTTHNCSRCTASYVDTYTDPTGHTDGTPVQEDVVPATCVVGGSYNEVIYCTVCHEKVSSVPKTIQATGHTNGAPVQENVVPSTCTAAGKYDEVIYCATCSTELSREEKTTDALGHNFSAWAVTVPGVSATCTADGVKAVEKRSCTRCHEEETRGGEVITATGHNYKTTVIAPTCTTQGYTAHTCTRCGDSYTDSPTAKLGHKWGAGVVTVEPTTQNEGKRRFVCTRCGTARYEVIPKLKVAEVTPTEKEADKAKVNKQIKKPTKIHTISDNKKKQLYIYFASVKGAQNYRVMYRKVGDKGWKKSWTKGKTEFTIKNLKANGLYEFKFAAYKKNSKGKWERGDYSTTSYRYYYKTVITKTKVAKNTVTVNWKRNKNADFYTIEYATNRDMKGSKKVDIKPNSKTSYKIKGLKKGKKYYIRIRSVKKSGGKNYIGEFSTRKVVTIK